MAAETIVGVISDTHGLLRPEAIAALRGSDLIIHAGDIGDPHILRELEKLAPTHAVRGNIDTEPWARALAEFDVLEVGEAAIYVLHDRKQLDLKPSAAGFAAVISGHSHKPAQEIVGGVLYFNPGSAGPRRFQLPVSVGQLRVLGKRVKAKIITLEV
jgi:uncharacterized protein